VLREGILEGTLIYQQIIAVMGAVIYQMQGGDMKNSDVRSEGT
jgi:hypothetical protein